MYVCTAPRGPSPTAAKGAQPHGGVKGLAPVRQRPTVYPTPVWGRADVPGYDAGPFVLRGYKWTARTTELHPDGECMHRPPRGETPGERDRNQRWAPPPPQPCLATSPTATGLGHGAHLTGTTGGKGKRQGRGARKRSAQLCRAKCRATISQRRAGRATESTRSPVSLAHTAFVS